MAAVPYDALFAIVIAIILFLSAGAAGFVIFLIKNKFTRNQNIAIFFILLCIFFSIIMLNILKR